MLKKDTFYQLTTLLFTAAGVVHLARAINEWDFLINDWELPMWASWLAVVVTWTLAWHAYKSIKK